MINGVVEGTGIRDGERGETGEKTSELRMGLKSVGREMGEKSNGVPHVAQASFWGNPIRFGRSCRSDITPRILVD